MKPTVMRLLGALAPQSEDGKQTARWRRAQGGGRFQELATRRSSHGRSSEARRRGPILVRGQQARKAVFGPIALVEPVGLVPSVRRPSSGFSLFLSRPGLRAGIIDYDYQHEHG